MKYRTATKVHFFIILLTLGHAKSITQQVVSEVRSLLVNWSYRLLCPTL